MNGHFSVVETSRGGAGLFDEEEEEDLFAEGKKEESEKEEPAPPAKQENKKKVRSGIRHISVYRIDSFSHIVINGFWSGGFSECPWLIVLFRSQNFVHNYALGFDNDQLTNTLCYFDHNDKIHASLDVNKSNSWTTK